jgi:hypothetical protein
MLTVGVHRETSSNLDFGISNERQDCKIGTVCWGSERYLWEGERKRLRRGNMVDGLHMHIRNRKIKHLPIAFSGEGGCWGAVGGGWGSGEGYLPMNKVNLFGIVTMNPPEQ